jgi:hypothetical protein
MIFCRHTVYFNAQSFSFFVHGKVTQSITSITSGVSVLSMLIVVGVKSPLL